MTAGIALNASRSRSQPPARAAGEEASASHTAAHALEDTLCGVAIAAIALDNRVGPHLLFDVIQLLFDARTEGRASELLGCARAEAQALPEWECQACGEANPGTFELCWCCAKEHCLSAQHLTTQSEALLSTEAAVLLESEQIEDGHG